MLLANAIVLLFSEELLGEFVDVVQRPKLKKYFSQSDVALLLELIEGHAHFVLATTKVDACRDEKDNFLLSLAVDGNADYLLTGDNDLLVLEKFGNTQIVTLSEFFQVD